MVVIADFPNTTVEPFIQTSHEDVRYNCIAWAASDDTKWYEPDPYGLYYWPKNIDREYTTESYISLYETLGYTKCENGTLEGGFLKVAVFENGGLPSHAARQLADGNWTSKLGKNIDVRHTIFSIENGLYGIVIQYLKRPL
jgi:hypothetical protein